MVEYLSNVLVPRRRGICFRGFELKGSCVTHNYDVIPVCMIITCYEIYSDNNLHAIHKSGDTSHFPASKSTLPGSPTLATPLVGKKVNRNGRVQWIQLL